MSDDRRHVMFAVRFKSDISQQHDLVVATHLFESSLQVLSWIVELSRKPFFIGAHNARRSSHQSFAVRVIARHTNERAHCILRLLARGSLKGLCAARSQAFFRRTVESYDLIHLTFPLWICRLPRNGSARDKSQKSSDRSRVVRSEGTMHYLLTAACVVAFFSVIQESNAQDAVRFAPLQADQLTPEQKKW